MDLNEQMKADNANFFSKSQKESIYNKDLIPLKLKISQILLYDPEAASVFLQRYNEISKKEDMTTIMKDIVELENEINEYKNSDNGKEKLSEEQSTIINNKLESLLGKCEELDIKDFEGEFSDIKEIYSKNSENYSYSDKDSIESKIASVQAKLIMIKARKNILDLHSEIAEDDVPRLAMVINHAIYTLLQSKNPNIQDIVNEIKYKMIDRQDTVYDVEIWRLLDSAQRSGERIEQKNDKTDKGQRKGEIQNLGESSQNTLLPAIPKQRRNFQFPNLGNLFQGRILKKGRTLKIGKQRMALADTVVLGDKTVKVQDLANIDMEWLVEQIPEELLIAAEDAELEKEGKSNVEQKYLKDGRSLIYTAIYNLPTKEDYSFAFYGNSGCKSHLKKKDCYITINQDSKNSRQIYQETGRNIDRIYAYTIFIDSMIRKSNLTQQFYDEIGNFFKFIEDNNSKEHNKILGDDISKLIKRLPIFNNLYKSYRNLERYVYKTKDTFEKQETAKRKKFYENSQFKNELKVDTKLEPSTFREKLAKANENRDNNNQRRESTSDRGGE